MRQHGFSLVELMISIVIGMLVVNGALIVYSSTYGANSSQMRLSRINNDLRMAMTQITRDLKRSQSKNWPAYDWYTDDEVNFISDGGGLANAPAVTGSTISVSYDDDSDGTPTTYQYQLSGGAIQGKIGSGAWTNITDPNVVTITAFTIVTTTNTITNCDHYDATTSTYNISISGTLVKDNSITRTIQETVRPRNEVITASAACT